MFLSPENVLLYKRHQGKESSNDYFAQVQMPNVYLPSIADFDFTDPLNGYLVADKFNIRQTHDGGTTWNIATLVPSETLDAYPTLVTLKGSNSELAYTAGNARKFVEVNGLQASFPTLDLPVAVSSEADITDLGISAIDHTLKYMLVRDGTTTGAEGYFLQKGTSWATKKKWNTKNPRGLWVFRNDNVIIAGTKSLVWYYDGSTVTDYGDDLPTGLTLNAVTFFDDINGYVAGEEGKLYKSSGWTFDTYPFVVTPTNIWEPKNTLDNLGGQTVQANINIKALATPGRFSLMSGGSYSPPGTAHIGYSRITHDESITFSTRFWYDRIGRLILSQNTKQFNQTPQQYSYTLYDALGRITEAGVKEENTGTGSPPLFKSIFGAWVSNYYNPNVIDNTKLEAWITEEDDARSEVTRTFYDAPLSGLSIADFTQENLRKRIASVSYAESYDSDPLTYDYASHYSYDIHGNVKSMVQDNQLLSTIVTDQRYKRLDYNYDLISGKVNEVRYQKGKADEWNHRYTYDADNRIKNVKTSTNYIIWDEDAKYFYYEHGPLARTELGQNKVQGIDYVYTLQGWLKGINSTTLDSNRDVGQDGYSSSANEQFAPDAYSYSLGYYTEDYKPIDATNKWTTVASRFISNPAGSFMLTHRDDLHNGNISYMMTTITDPSDGSRLPQATAYRYDQLNRLLEERAFNNINETTNQWNSSGSYSNRYFNAFTYDANGNIISQKRHNKAGTAVDDLTYRYFDDADEIEQNRLYMVDDNVSPSAFADDIDDQGTFNNALASVNTGNNYSYTELGELKKDEQEEIESIVWRTDGKIKEIIRESTSSKKNLKFEYDPMGNRIAKHVLTSANVEESVTYYVRDAQGNIMSTYVKTAPGSILSYKVEERHLYGSSRLGIYGEQSEMIGATVSTTYFNHLLGKRSFEGVNHLGNVLTVFSDRKFPQNSGGDVSGFKAELFTSQDYYPFGMLMPGRNFSSSSYELGFNSMLSDNEIFGLGNSYNTFFREYDSRLGRWWSIDPVLKSNESPYVSFNNNPIFFSDPRGDDPPEKLKPENQISYFIKKASNSVANIFRTTKYVVPKSSFYMVELTEEKTLLNNAFDVNIPHGVKNDIETNGGEIGTITESYRYSEHNEIKMLSFNFSANYIRELKIFRKNFFGKEKEVFTATGGQEVQISSPFYKANRLFVTNKNDIYKIVVQYKIPEKPVVTPEEEAENKEFAREHGTVLPNLFIYQANTLSFRLNAIIKATSNRIEELIDNEAIENE